MYLPSANTLQFQYIALIRYCQNTHATRKPLQNALTEAEKKLASMQDLASEEHAKVLSLQQENERLHAQKDQFEAMSTEVQRLQGIEQELELFRRLDVNPRDLETFTTNKAAIRHYLKLVPRLLE
jgi:peptidase E